MLLTIALGTLSLVSLVLMLWQLLAGLRYPRHRVETGAGFAPPVSVLKPLRGCDVRTRECLASWLEQAYPGPVQFLFGVADSQDPVCAVVRELLRAHPDVEGELVVCAERMGPNAKVSSLLQLCRQARHEFLVISDADVWAPNDLLRRLVPVLRDPAVGLVCCLYRLARPFTVAMWWEAIGINADFWAQVLQARDLQIKDFALGAVMGTTRARFESVGGAAPLLDYLADDFQLGRRMARSGARVELCPVVVECRERPMGWVEVWEHQLRWARTIRSCRPGPYFFSLLGNGTIWPLLFGLLGDAGGFWLALEPQSYGVAGYPSSQLYVGWAVLGGAVCVLFRILAALGLQLKLTRRLDHFPWWWMVPVRDLLQAGVWAVSYCGRQIVWRGERFRLRPGGGLEASG